MASTSRQNLIEEISKIARRAAEREGIEIWEVELLGSGRAKVVRIYIDKPEGVSHADCELISEQVSRVLDVESIMPDEHYTLEVSSPGVERRLRGPSDFVRYAGQKARFQLREPIENQRRWEGTLAACEEGLVTLETAPGKTVRFRADQVEKANLKFEW
jgi:ribosome maturation factor RimP